MVGLCSLQRTDCCNVERKIIEKEAAREDIRGQVISYATARGEEALDKAEGFETSPYTTVVSRKLSQKNKDIVDALVDAHKEVAELSGFRQRPYLSTSMNGHVYLAKQPTSRKCKAILVAVDDANDGKKSLLSAPKRDVEAITRSLTSMGLAPSQIQTLYNADAETISGTIREVTKILLS